MCKQPLISIIIPVYNGSNYLQNAIDSALNQTYQNVEIIVVNDGSNDDGKTEKIALSYGDKIRYFHKENGGVSTALNLGISKMKGEYFSWLSHDDMYLPNKIKCQIDALEGFGKPTLCLCDAQQVDKTGSVIKKAKKAKKYTCGLNEWHDALNIILDHGACNGCALLIPKIVFDDVGGFDETLRYSQDALMWMKIFLNKYNLVYINETGVSSRVHNGQLTQTGRTLFHSDSEKISEQIIPKLVNEVYAKKFLYSYAYHNAILNNEMVVKNCLIVSKKSKTLSVYQKLKIKMAIFYGKIRPFIRKLYYKLFRKIKTT